MATITKLEANGLIKVLVELDRGKQPERLFFASSGFQRWLENELSELGSTWNLDETPQMQMNSLLAQFIGGDALAFGRRFKVLKPIGDGVWELKTADLRIIGWFATKDCFVAVCADTAEQIKQYRLYDGYRRSVARFRDALPIDEPKFVAGDNPDDVISVYD